MTRLSSFFRFVVNHLLGLLMFYVLVLFVVGTLFAMFEGKDWSDSLWWAAVTATTTGYGDIFPTTVPGRIIAVFVMHFGAAFAFPVATAIITARLVVDSDAFTHSEQEEIKTMLARIEDELRRRES